MFNFESRLICDEKLFVCSFAGNRGEIYHEQSIVWGAFSGDPVNKLQRFVVTKGCFQKGVGGTMEQHSFHKL